MRKLFVCLLAITPFLSGCFKEDNGCTFTESSLTAPASEVTNLENYLFNSGITTATKHPAGFYYEILTPGSGLNPTICSSVSVGYSGKLTDGTEFDQTSSVSFQLGRTIEGWRKGLPLIQKGGHIKLYIPPTLGYGATDIKNEQTGQIIIPANSILIFDISLIDVQ